MTHRKVKPEVGDIVDVLQEGMYLGQALVIDVDMGKSYHGQVLVKMMTPTHDFKQKKKTLILYVDDFLQTRKHLYEAQLRKEHHEKDNDGAGKNLPHKGR